MISNYQMVILCTIRKGLRLIISSKCDILGRSIVGVINENNSFENR